MSIFLLFWLSLIPVLTEWLRDAYRHALPAAADGAVLLAAGVGLAFVSPWISYVLYVAVAVIWFVPDRRFTRL